MYKFEKRTPKRVWPQSDFFGRRTKSPSPTQIIQQMNKTTRDSAPIWRRHRQSTKIHDCDDDDDEFCGSTTRPREAFTVYLWRVRGHYVYRRAVWLLCLSLAGVGGQRCASPPPRSSATCMWPHGDAHCLTSNSSHGTLSTHSGCMNKSVSNLFVCGDSLLPFSFFLSFLFIFREETLVKTAAAVTHSLTQSVSVAILSRALHIYTPFPRPSPSSISFLLWVLLWWGGQFMHLLIFSFTHQSLLYAREIFPQGLLFKFSTALPHRVPLQTEAHWMELKMMNSCQYLLKSKKKKEEEAKEVEPFAPCAYLNEFNSVCVLHLGPGPCGTLSFSLPSPREKVCMVLGRKVEGQNTKCLRGMASGMIDREKKTSHSSNLMRRQTRKKLLYYQIL